jgi:hypothetical protein
LGYFRCAKLAASMLTLTQADATSTAF